MSRKSSLEGILCDVSETIRGMDGRISLNISQSNTPNRCARVIAALTLVQQILPKLRRDSRLKLDVCQSLEKSVSTALRAAGWVINTKLDNPSNMPDVIDRLVTINNALPEILEDVETLLVALGED